MKKTKRKLEIDTCIVIGDARRIQKGKKAIKSMRQLSIELFKRPIVKKDNLSASSVYWKMYRKQTQGFVYEDKQLVDAICKTLLVKKDELIKEL